LVDFLMPYVLYVMQESMLRSISTANQYGSFVLDVHWFSGLMLCICSLCHFVCDSS